MLTRHAALRLAATLIVAALAVGAAQAQGWPNRSVKFVLPLGPGSGVDITARLVADRLAAKWGQPVVIENRPGGDGVIAITTVTGAADDHTLLVSPTSSFTHHPWTHEKMPYNPRDLVPVARMTHTLVAVVVQASSPINSLADLMAAVKAQPGQFNWATITGFFDFVFEGYQKKAGLQIAKVPYRNTVQAANDLAEGRIQLMLAAYAIVRPLVEAGKLKILAFTGSQRAAAVPHIPTAAEAGFPDLAFDGLVGVFGPRNITPAARDRIAADIRDVLRDPAMVERLTATGQVVNPGSPAELSASMEAQQAQAAATGVLLGIKPAQF